MSHDRATTGHMHSGPAHEVVANLFFAGRRRRVYGRLAVLSGARAGDQVLDVGCGDGYFTRLLAPVVGPTGAVRGVDPSAPGIARARSLAKAPMCTYLKGTAVALDIPDGTYDVVVSTLVLHHLDDTHWPRALGEMLRVVRPGGHLLIAEFRPPSNPITRRLIRPLTSTAMLDIPLDLLPQLITEAGFANVSTGDLRPWIHYLHAHRPGTGR